jgi:hypothetical protein
MWSALSFPLAWSMSVEIGEIGRVRIGWTAIGVRGRDHLGVFGLARPSGESRLRCLLVARTRGVRRFLSRTLFEDERTHSEQRRTGEHDSKRKSRSRAAGSSALAALSFSLPSLDDQPRARIGGGAERSRRRIRVIFGLRINPNRCRFGSRKRTVQRMRVERFEPRSRPSNPKRHGRLGLSIGAVNSRVAAGWRAR